jgi:hypothetical protein
MTEEQTMAMTELTLPCFCGKKLSFSIEEGALAHMMPTCRVFDAMEPDDFLTLLRKYYQALGLIAKGPI